MALKYSQKEIELEIANVLDYSDIDKIAENSGIGYSYVQQQLNPNDPRKSYIVGALEIICALDDICPAKGEKVWQIMAKRREMSKPAPDQNLCIEKETGRLAKEIADCVAVALEGAPLDQQMQEILEAEAQIKKTKYAIINAAQKQNGKLKIVK